MATCKIKKGDTVKVIAGKDKGKEGKVTSVDVKNGKVVVPPIKYDVICDVLKDRFGSGAGREIGLFYDKPSRRFYDSIKTLDYHYGWDKRDYSGIPLPYGAGVLDYNPADEAFGTLP